MLKRRVSLSLTMLIGLILIIALPTQAADFSVSTAQELIDAINTANANAEADIITLTADITLTAVDNNADFVTDAGVAGSDGNNDGPNGLPLISSEITIEGDNFTISRDGTAPDFRLFVVVGSGILSLNNVTISNGSAIDSSPATFDRTGGGDF